MNKHHEEIKHKFEPRENQIQAINQGVDGLANVGFHGLFLEMGLGKSKVSLNIAEILNKYGSLKNILIICPKALLSVWKIEIPKHTYFENEPLIWNSSKIKTKKYQYAVSQMMVQETSIFIVNIEAFQTKNKHLLELLKSYLTDKSMVILDESSTIKNIGANRTLNLINLTKSATYKLALTGTEITNSPLDIFAQFEFLASNFWYDNKKPKSAWYLFKNRYAIFKEIRIQEGRTIKTIVGSRRTEEIAKKITPYITRQKKDIWLDLPEKIFIPINIDMNPEQAKIYISLKESMMAEFGDEILTATTAIALLTRLRQVAGGFFPETGEPIGKPPGIATLLSDVEEYSGKVVIFATYISEIEGIIEALKGAYGKDQVVDYYGATKDRDESLRAFNNEARFFVSNISVGSKGLNLDCANLMYFYSKTFSSEDYLQAVDRIHRLNQRKICIYKSIIHNGTIQEKIERALSGKEKMIDKFQKMTIRDLLN
jgi:SNF2 family DNA or RNA helicase